ncbi:aluminum-activated malate transporter 2-like [Mangifera indica]|uniref:aluminum-activated malate transporter 2-like n=1 Tax=Mangifera indica TaxID=29780 RepID=UPI001CFAF2D6|nr:aluminum-activated malate transporter 2-like [Mangifera indica]
MASSSQENNNKLLSRVCELFKSLQKKFCTKVFNIVEKAQEVAKGDPRRIIHSLKVGLALTFVSLFYYFQPLYDGLGVNAMWAVLTVVVVFEFSVGATLGKGVNRMLATLTGGFLAVGAHRTATLSGRTGEPIFIAIFVFIIASTVTFMRFFPTLKARCDYGLSIFILTFSLISVSGYRDNEVLHMAHQRLSTIIIGSCTAIIVCISICPVWVGEELHNLVCDNIEKLGKFLEAFEGEYFEEFECGKSDYDKSFLHGYRSVLDSKNCEETMAQLARWEPSHGGFKFGHPWKQYLKIGTLTRQCAYKIETLQCQLKHSKIQASLELQKKIQEACIKISTESGKSLKELALATKTMTQSKSSNTNIANLRKAVENLKTLLTINHWEEVNLLEIIPLAAIASILMEVVQLIENISEVVHELASMAHFKCEDAKVSPKQPCSSKEGTIQSIATMTIEKHEDITFVE